MQCTVGFELYRGQQQWIAEPFGFPGITQGETMAEACESAADLVRETMLDMAMHGEEIPRPVLDAPLSHGGERLLVSVEASLDSVAKVSAAQAARMLGVSRPRITALLKNGRLDGWTEGRNTWVTLDSVQARLDEIVKPGRPKAEQPQERAALG